MKVTVLSKHDNKVVAVRQDNQLALAFHPELVDDTTVYEYSFNIVKNRI